jgi:hypothetical protein
MQYLQHLVSGLKRDLTRIDETQGGPPAEDHGRSEFKTVWIFCCGMCVSQSWLCCDVGLLSKCVLRSLEEGSSSLGCVDGKGVQAMDAWEKEEGGTCVQPLEVCHQSDLLLGPSFRLLGPTSMASGIGSSGQGNTTRPPG